jgi:hypothetical protein
LRGTVDGALWHGRGTAQIGIGETSGRINVRCAAGIAGKAILTSDPPHLPFPSDDALVLSPVASIAEFEDISEDPNNGGNAAAR